MYMYTKHCSDRRTLQLQTQIYADFGLPLAAITVYNGLFSLWMLFIPLNFAFMTLKSELWERNPGKWKKTKTKTNNLKNIRFVVAYLFYLDFFVYKNKVDYNITQKSFNFPKKHGLPFYFVSASDGTNVVKVSTYMQNKILFFSSLFLLLYCLKCRLWFWRFLWDKWVSSAFQYALRLGEGVTSYLETILLVSKTKYKWYKASKMLLIFIVTSCITCFLSRLYGISWSIQS